ncbi:MAG: hypothetical protein PHW73_07640, partial [Atribacterota bacterium]|nr:hypothetical protein [Atribacterota bacterium]
MIEKLLKLNTKIVIILYILIEIICVGMGMGVPIFCILFGFPFGWYIVRRICTSMEYSYLILYQILKLSFLASVFTFLLMIVIW